MRVAILSNNVVQNIIEVENIETAELLHSDCLCIELSATEYCEIGHGAKDGKLLPAPIVDAPEPIPAPVKPAALVTTRFSKIDFRKKFTFSELVELDNWKDSTSLTDLQKRAMNTIQANFDLAEYLDFTDQMTIDGINYLETVGIIDSGRAAEIMGA